MIAVKKSKTRKASQKTFRIRYKDGQEDHVSAYRFVYQPKQGDLIQFYDSEKRKAKDLLLRAPEVASVIESSRMLEAPPLLTLQGQMKNLEGRIDALEKSFVDIVDVVTRAVDTAVDTAFAKRELKLSS
jgi:hypothetical protein